MAWVFKRTDLESTFAVNMNALVPSPDGGLSQPVRLDLKTMLEHWLDFRYETIRRRYVHDLGLLEQRIHVLEGFAIVFADLDEVIRLIRESEGKKDAARRLIERFGLSEIQTDAILELRLYKLARLEIQLILDELEEKRAAAAEIRDILGSEARLWQRVRTELLELRALYADPRRTAVGAAEADGTPTAGTRVPPGPSSQLSICRWSWPWMTSSAPSAASTASMRSASVRRRPKRVP